MDGRKRVLAVLLALFTVMTSAPVARAAEIGEVTGFGSNPGNLRMFRYTPDGLPGARPVVVALHGCTQNGPGYGTSSGWRELADRWKFTLVLPQTDSGNNASSCFNWFQPADIARDSGEAASIMQMTQRAITDANADPARVFVTGLSAGGAMTAVMLATYPERFAAGAVVAGLPYRCAENALEAQTPCMNPGRDLSPAEWGDRVRAASGHTGRWPAVSVYHGDADYLVNIANQRELVDQWTNVHGTDTTPDTSDTVAGYPHEVYRDGSGAAVVETYRITGMGHGQPVDPGGGDGQCGSTGAYFLAANLCAAWQIGRTWGLAS